MSIQLVLIDTALTAAQFEAKIRPLINNRSMVTRLADFLINASSGVERVNLFNHFSGVQAGGTITFASFVQDDTVTLNGVVLTGKDAPSGAAQFLTGVSDESSANALAALINSSSTAKIIGCMSATRRGTLIFASFVQNDTITVNGIVFTGRTTPDPAIKTQFAVGTTNTMCAVNAAAAINRMALDHPLLAGCVATSSSATVTVNTSIGNVLATNGVALTLAASAHCTVAAKIIVITSVVSGAIGNLMTLAISAHGSVSGAALTGGTDGNFYAFFKK